MPRWLLRSLNLRFSLIVFNTLRQQGVSDDLGQVLSQFYEPRDLGEVITTKVSVKTKAGYVEPFLCAKYCAQPLPGTATVNLKGPEEEAGESLSSSV